MLVLHPSVLSSTSLLWVKIDGNTVKNFLVLDLPGENEKGGGVRRLSERSLSSSLSLSL